MILCQDLDEAVSAASREPWVYLRCGHVYSYHSWKASVEDDNSQRTCPLCRKVGPYVKLEPADNAIKGALYDIERAQEKESKPA